VFSLTITPSVVIADQRVAPKQTTINNVALRLPLVPNQDLAKIGTNTIHPLLDDTNIRKGAALIGVLNQENVAVQIGILQTDIISTGKFDKTHQEILDHCRYERICQILRQTYVGRGLVDTITNRLNTLRQKSTNNGIVTIASVNDHYQTFANIVAESDPNVAYPVSLAYTFLNSLADDLREKIIEGGYVPPTGSAKVLQHGKLATLKDLALGAEREHQRLAAMISQTVAPRRRGANVTTALMMQPQVKQTQQTPVLFIYPTQPGRKYQTGR